MQASFHEIWGMGRAQKELNFVSGLEHIFGYFIVFIDSSVKIAKN